MEALLHRMSMVRIRREMFGIYTGSFTFNRFANPQGWQDGIGA
jgi:hypothetical protein